MAESRTAMEFCVDLLREELPMLSRDLALKLINSVLVKQQLLAEDQPGLAPWSGWQQQIVDWYDVAVVYARAEQVIAEEQQGREVA